MNACSFPVVCSSDSVNILSESTELSISAKTHSKHQVNSSNNNCFHESQSCIDINCKNIEPAGAVVSGLGNQSECQLVNKIVITCIDGDPLFKWEDIHRTESYGQFEYHADGHQLTSSSHNISTCDEYIYITESPGDGCLCDFLNGVDKLSLYRNTSTFNTYQQLVDSCSVYSDDIEHLTQLDVYSLQCFQMIGEPSPSSPDSSTNASCCKYNNLSPVTGDIVHHKTTTSTKNLFKGSFSGSISNFSKYQSFTGQVAMAVRQFQEVEGGYQCLFGFLPLEVVRITEYHGSRLLYNKDMEQWIYQAHA